MLASRNGAARRRASDEDLTTRQRVRKRAAVYILQLTAHRHAVGDTAGANAATIGDFAEEVCGRVPLDGGVGGEDQFAHRAVSKQRLQLAPSGPMPSSGERCPISTK